MESIINKDKDGSLQELPFHQSGMMVIDKAGPKKAQRGMFLPLREINSEVAIKDQVAYIKMTQEYYNPAKEQPQGESGPQKEEPTPIEVVFKFPKEPTSIISKMIVSLDDKIVEAKIMEKKKAEDKYDDAMAERKFATILKESDNKDLHELNVGNVQPGQTVIAEIHIVQPLKLSGGAFNFVLPITYFPKYTSSKSAEKAQSQPQTLVSKESMGDFRFNIKATIESTDTIIEVSHPTSCEIIEQSLNLVTIQKKCSLLDLVEDINIYYKTQNQGTNQISYQRSALYPGQVAVMTQLMPGLEQRTAPQKIKFYEDEALDEDELQESLDQKFTYIFIVDRSGSMGCDGRMKITVDALKLFMQSLPEGSMFQIISFGDYFHPLTFQMDAQAIKYEQNFLKQALSEIEQMDSDMGGTEIYDPIKFAFDMKSEFKKRIFLLTDGSVSQPNQVVDLIRKECEDGDHTKVFSFGIGSGCSRDLVLRSAQAGKGQSFFIGDREANMLRVKVVEALAQASKTAFSDSKLNFEMGTDTSEQEYAKYTPATHQIGDFLCGTYHNFATIMSEKQFEGLKCSFEYTFEKKSATTDLKLSKELTFPDSDNDQLFKLAAKQLLNKFPEVGLKYKILCATTAFIGVIKQKSASSEEIKQVEMPTITGKVKQEPARVSNMNYLQSQIQNRFRSMNNGAVAECAAMSDSESEDECMDMGGLFGDESDGYGAGSFSYGAQKTVKRSMPVMQRNSLKEEEEEAEDVDMGGLFGGEESDYGEETFTAKKSMPVRRQASPKMKKMAKPAMPAMPQQLGMAMPQAMAMQQQMPQMQAMNQGLFAQNQMKQQMQMEQLQDLNDMMEESMEMDCMAMPQSVGLGSIQSAAISNQNQRNPGSLNDIISAQTVSGFWPNFVDLLKNLSPSEQAQVKQIASSYPLDVFSTVLALSILKNIFKAQKAEWDMIQKKAKKWLRKQDKAEEAEEAIKNIIESNQQELEMLERLMAL